MARILVVEDEGILRRNIVERLRADSHDVVEAVTGEAGVELARLLSPDLVVTDLRLPGMDGHEVLRQTQLANPRLMVVILTAHGSGSAALRAIQEGAYDYIMKPASLRELALLVDRALRHCRSLDGIEHARRQRRHYGTFSHLIGVSPAMRALKHELREFVRSPDNMADPPPSVLITGESGSGKTLVAHVLHQEGPRSTSRLVQLDCAQVSGESDWRAEIERAIRASSDADPHAPNDFESIGTIFLDNISKLAAGSQMRLFELLCSRDSATRSGEDTYFAKAQFIFVSRGDAAKKLESGTQVGRMIELLSARVFRIPALRDRPEDAALLAGMAGD